MKIALFSDIHANLEAFEAVLADMKHEGVQRYIFLGDLVGYGASPNECIRLLQALTRESSCLSLAGNHDYAVAGQTPYEHYAALASLSIDWTIKRLSREEISFLSGLPLVADVGPGFLGPNPVEKSFVVVHANLVYPQGWGYIWDIDDAFLSFQVMTRPVCFIGHSHKPMIFTSGENVDWFICDLVSLQQGLKYVINVGSVGQPRDGNPRACYVLYDTDQGTIVYRRVEYDIAKAQQKILAAGLPQLLANRLVSGK